MVNNVVSKAFVSLVIILIAFGTLFGMVASDSEFLNPRASTTLQSQKEEEIRHQQELNRLEEERRASELALALEEQKAKTETAIALNQKATEAKAIFVYIREAIFSVFLALILITLWVGGVIAVKSLIQNKQKVSEPTYIPATLRIEKTHSASHQSPSDGNGKYHNDKHLAQSGQRR